jgi:hypothetical protein
VTSTVLATRGGRLALTRTRFSDHDHGPEAVLREVLAIVEINVDERIVATVVFDPDDVEAALEELDARYLAGEAAAHAQTWSVISGLYANFGRHELPRMTQDSVFLDHRPVVTTEVVDLAATNRAMWDITPDASVYLEVVHRLSEFGAVVTQLLKGTSQEGFDAEWRTVGVYTLEGDLLSRVEAFDEADIDAALARFEELQPQAPRLENAASQVAERFLARFSAADWDAMAQMLADNFSRDDRRRVVGAGSRSGRDAWLRDMRATADLWSANVTTTVMATRGGRLALMRGHFSHRDQAPEAFRTELLNVAEIDADERIVALVMFDADDIDAAVAELDARYLAGEAAAHSHIWSVIAGAYAGFNRHEFPATTADSVYTDHRPLVTAEAVDLAASLHALWDLTPDISICIEAVHRLSELGAVITFTAHGTSHEGLAADWRVIQLHTVEGDRINRSEIFDETDLDTALARFNELHQRAPRLENAASQVAERFLTHFAAGDWDSVSKMVGEDFLNDDRRRVVGSGVRHGRDAEIADLRAIADVWPTNLTSTVMATRGESLILIRVSASDRDHEPDAFLTDALCVLEIDADERVVAAVSFDADDIDAAFDELDARYLAGEAAAYSHTWTAITQLQTLYNRHEFPPTTKDWVNTDHRRGRAFAPGEFIPFLRATYDVAPNLKGHIEAVHRLSNLGVVITEVMTGTSEEGFTFEWREIGLFAFDGGLVCRFELFDEADLDYVLARFDELDRPASS